MNTVQRSPPGFRCSFTDVLVLIIAPLATWWLWPQLGAMAAVILFAVGHFFLFCNVFRVHRNKELLWAGAAIINVGIWTIAGQWWWPGILLAQSPLTLAVITWEISSPGYHGIGWNPLKKSLPTTPDQAAAAPPPSDPAAASNQVSAR